MDIKDSDTEVLIKLTFYPRRNYDGADMLEYKIVSLKTALILKEFIKNYKDTVITFYCGFDGEREVEHIEIYIYQNDAIINAYKLLKTRGVIGDIHGQYDGSYYIYNLLVEGLMSLNMDDYNGEHCDSVTEEEIWEKWASINSTEDV
jgi:hypothetical protein